MDIDLSRSADTALAAYGTLGPGQPNHFVVKPAGGEWLKGTVRGFAFDITWGPADGYPGVVLDPDGGHVEVDLLVSDTLPKFWHEIDRFEGPGYRRVEVDVWADGVVIARANIYEALTDS